MPPLSDKVNGGITPQGKKSTKYCPTGYILLEILVQRDLFY
jgi:hypothetical protein